MEDIKDKKLLFLGGNPETTRIVEIANKLGVKTYVTSFRPNDDAKKIAYKPFDVDGMDVEGLVQLVKDEEIDGVMVGVADPLVPYYSKVCEKLGLPCYATQKIVDVISYKDVFKQTCERYGIHGIPEYHLDADLKEEDIKNIVYPVMVKPVDSCSGTGMTVVYNEQELKAAVEKALSCSTNKRFIVERYMLCDDFAVYYTFKDGECSVSCTFDRFTSGDQPGLARVNLGSTYPSIHTEEYFQKVHPNAVKMFKDLGINNGVLLIQAFYENGDFYVYDPGFRLQGEGCHLLINAINGFDQRELLINFALTGSEGDIDLLKEDDVYFRGKAAATLWFLLKDGKIKHIEGLENIENDPNIVYNFQRFVDGDVVQPEWVGTEKQVLTRLYIVCNNKNELAETITKYRNKIKVFDTNGNNMVLKGFDAYEVLGLK